MEDLTLLYILLYVITYVIRWPGGSYWVKLSLCLKYHHRPTALGGTQDLGYTFSNTDLPASE